jgi:pimeloyl-ACP methyl ester carboxylesterase
MKRVTSVAPVLIMGALLAPVRAQSIELALSHVVNDREVSTTLLNASPGEIRGKGASTDGANELLALLLRDPNGRFVRYERDLTSARDGTVLSRVTLVAEGDVLALRERGPMGSRTKSVSGPPIDVVVDAAFPEAFIPFLLDASRKSVRAVLLPELEIKTLVIEDRGERGRYAAVPGGGITLLTDGSGGFAKLVLPGPEARVVVPSSAAREAPASRGHQNRVVLEVGGGRLGFTLTLPTEGTGHPAFVLLGDSGPRDRDGVGSGSLVPVLKLLADELAAIGIATVRADKRGVGDSTGPDPGLAALVGDARALLDVVALHPAIDHSRVFLAGHGEGAVVAAELARQQRAGIAGIVTLAGPARPLSESLEARLRVRLAAAGQLPEAIDEAVAELRSEVAELRALPDDAPLLPGQALLRDLASVDPSVQIAALRLPILVVHGGADRETPASQVAMMRASLAFSADRARFELLEGADHDLLMAPDAGGGAPAATSADVARRLHPRVGPLIREFVDRTRPASRPESR